MTEETLRQLVAGGETATVEFKSKAPRPAELAERMCGMANSRVGGVIIFGVEDGTQAVVIVAQPSETIDTALRAARMIRPPLTITDTTIRTWVLDKRSLVTVEIPPTDGRLYQYAGAFLILSEPLFASACEVVVAVQAESTDEARVAAAGLQEVLYLHLTTPPGGGWYGRNGVGSPWRQHRC